MRYQRLIFWTLFLFFFLISMSIVSSAAEYREINASEILRQIKNGEDVNFTECHINGELNLSEIELKSVPNPKYYELLESGFSEEELKIYGVNRDLKIVESSIKISNSTFENDLDFSNLLFKKSVCFAEVNYCSKVNFISSNFSNTANFSGATFGDSAEFYGSIFGDSAEFSKATFGNFVDFGKATFGDNANFKKATFGYNADFGEATFGNFAEFHGATFGDDAYFVGVTFGDNAYFVGATFGDSAHFSGTIFGDSVNFGGHVTIIYPNSSKDEFFGTTFGDFAGFGGATFGDSANFGKVTFGDSACFLEAAYGDFATFSGAIFGDSADFIGSNFGDSVFFVGANFINTSSFEGTQFAGTVDFSGAKFKNVSLNGTDFKEMKVSWDSFESSLVFDGPTYVKLIKNFRDLEQFEDADTAYFQYRKHCQAEKSWIPFSKKGSKWWDIVMCITCGYGVKPFSAFYLGSLIILLFSFVYRGFPTIFWRNRRDSDVTQQSPTKTLLSLIPEINWPNPGISRLSENKDSAQKVTFWDSFYFSMVTFSTIGYGDWYPKDNFRKWVMFEGLLGWVILGLFLVTLTNVMIRP